MQVAGHDFTNIRPKPWLLQVVPFVGKRTAQTLFGTVYLPHNIYKNLCSQAPGHYTIALVLHEETHADRQRHQGAVRWTLKYMYNARFRFEEEIAALQPQIAYLHSVNVPFNTERMARSLSGWLYRFPVSYEEALRRLTEL